MLRLNLGSIRKLKLGSLGQIIEKIDVEIQIQTCRKTVDVDQSEFSKMNWHILNTKISTEIEKFFNTYWHIPCETKRNFLLLSWRKIAFDADCDSARLGVCA